MNARGRISWIDVHHHILPERYVASMSPAAIAGPSPTGILPAWSRAADLESLDRHGIDRAITSISAPGVLLDDERATAALARSCNEYAADMTRGHPQRYASFAALPLPFVAASLAEIDYAFDTLGACGVALLTNYHGRYPGDAAFDPVFAALDARRAIVFVHPAACAGPVCDPGLSAATLEFPFDTARAVASLILNRRHLDYPHIRYVFCHAGGALPAVARRLAQHAARTPAIRARGELDVAAAIGALFFDTAGYLDAAALAALRALVPLEHVLFGTDVPFAPSAGSAQDALLGLGLPAAELASIAGGNAQALFS
jgi:predicted TIM-barrel fold metal-dependent hydrolase